MAQITKDQYKELQSKGLSDDKITSLASARGLAVPSKGVGGVLGAVADFTGVEKLGQGLGYSLFQLTPEYKELSRLLDNGSLSPEKFEELTTGNITNNEVIGSGIKTAANIVGAGELPLLSKASAAEKVAQDSGGFLSKILPRAKEGAIKGGKLGAIFGGASAAGDSTQNGDSLGDIAINTGTGIAAGAAGGALLGGLTEPAFGSIGDLVKSRKIAKQGLVDALQKQSASKVDSAISTLGTSPDAESLVDSLGVAAPIDTSTVNHTIDSTGKLVRDKNALNLIKGAALAPEDVAVLKGSSAQDRRAMIHMLDIADETSKNPIQSKVLRPIQRVGQTFTKYVNYLRNEETKVGKQIDQYAREKFKGVQIPAQEAVDNFNNTLSLHGVNFRSPTIPGSDVEILKDGSKDELDFRGSDFEDQPGVNRLLQTIYRRANQVGDDAYKAHQLKRLIDSSLEYGKRSNAEGLTAGAESIVKGLRHDLDTQLDNFDSNYKASNTRFSIATNARRIAESGIGKKFAETPEEELKSGQLLNQLLGNAPANAAHTINTVQQAVEKLTGKKSPDNLLLQTHFANLLSEIYGSEPRSFDGLIERAVTHAANSGDVTKGITGLFKDKAGEILKKAFTKSPDERAALIRTFIESMR